MKINKTGKMFVITGLLLMAAALCLTVYNIREQNRAAKAALQALEQIEAAKEENTSDIPDYLKNPYMDMPEKEINKQMYIGTLTIPDLYLQLPIISQWSDGRLKIAPCRFQGSVYLNDMIIMAHNYKSHFGSLSKLKIDDEVYFEDMDGNVFRYRVVEMEILSGYAIDDMVSGDWDLTLFTCTTGGQSRVTVRCELDND